MRSALSALLTAVALTACGGDGVEIEPRQAITPRNSPLSAAPTAPPRVARTPAATATPTASATPTPTPTPTVSDPLAAIDCSWADVVAIADGDTLDVALESGGVETVRLIGVDAPEGGQALGAESTAALIRLAGSRVCLEADITDRDRLGRLLRYAWTADATLINEALVAQGMALVVTFPPDTRYLASRYQPAEASARAAGRGLWNAAPPTSEGSNGNGACDPSYPDVCIPPASVAGDLDCPDIPERRFKVVPPDPHGFDRDVDGVGCES